MCINLIQVGKSGFAPISLRKAKLCNLISLYETFFNSLLEEKKSWVHITLEQSHLAPKLNLQRALTVHFTNIIYARLQAAVRTGSVLALFQSRWNPIILEVIAEDKLIGCVFLTRQSVNIFQINAISSVNPNQEEKIMPAVIVTLKKYVKTLGGTQIIIQTIENTMKQILQQSGFEVSFYDDVLFFDVKHNTDCIKIL